MTSSDKKARLFDTNMKNVVHTLTGHQSSVFGVAFSHDGSRVVTGGFDNTARVWDAATGELVSDPMPHRGGIWWAVRFSPDGRTVVTGCDDRTVRVWDVATSRPIGPALRHEAGVRMVAFSDDGSQVLTGTAVGNVRFWDATISPLEDDPERITVWVEVVTGFAFDSEGSFHVLDADSWKQRRARLRELGGPPSGS